MKKEQSKALVKFDTTLESSIKYFNLNLPSIKEAQEKLNTDTLIAKSEFKLDKISKFQYETTVFNNSTQSFNETITLNEQLLKKLEFCLLLSKEVTDDGFSKELSKLEVKIQKTKSIIEVTKSKISSLITPIEEIKDIIVDELVGVNENFKWGFNFSNKHEMDKFQMYVNEFKLNFQLDLSGKQVISEKYYDEKDTVNYIHRSFNDFRQLTASRNFKVIDDRGFTKMINFGEEFLKSDWMKKQFTKTTFKCSSEYVNKPKEYNLWEGYITPKKGDVSVFIEHIDKLIDDTVEGKTHLIKELAYAFRFPDKITGTTVCLVGEEGCGKSTLSKSIARMCPSHSKFISDMERILTSFNGETLTTKFFLWEEAHWGGSKTLEGKFKHFINGDTRQVQIKNVTTVEIPNVSFHLFTSNNDWVVHVGKTDRRNNIYRCTSDLIDNFDYFKKYNNWLDGEGKNALLHFLLYEVDLEGFNPMITHSTQIKVDVKLKNLDSFDSFMMMIMSNEIDEVLSDWDDIETAVRRDSMFDAYKNSSKFATLDRKEFSSRLSRLFQFPEKWNDNWKGKEKINGIQKSYGYYKMPIREVARELFSKTLKETSDKLFGSNKHIKTVGLDYNKLVKLVELNEANVNDYLSRIQNSSSDKITPFNKNNYIETKSVSVT